MSGKRLLAWRKSIMKLCLSIYKCIYIYVHTLPHKCACMLRVAAGGRSWSGTLLLSWLSRVGDLKAPPRPQRPQRLGSSNESAGSQAVRTLALVNERWDPWDPGSNSPGHLEQKAKTLTHGCQQKETSRNVNIVPPPSFCLTCSVMWQEIKNKSSKNTFLFFLQYLLYWFYNTFSLFLFISCVF